MAEDTNQTDEGLIKDIYERFLKEIQTIITLGYLLLVAIGMCFHYARYKLFGINIFEYADVFDFLIAPFEDFSIIFFFFLTVGIILIIFYLDNLLARYFPKLYTYISLGINHKSWYPQYRLFSFLFVFVMYLFLAADIYGKFYKFQFLEKEEITLHYADASTEKGRLIGKTRDVLFLFVQDRVQIIPIQSQLKLIEYPQAIEWESSSSDLAPEETDSTNLHLDFE